MYIYIKKQAIALSKTFSCESETMTTAFTFTAPPPLPHLPPNCSLHLPRNPTSMLFI